MGEISEFREQLKQQAIGKAAAAKAQQDQTEIQKLADLTEEHYNIGGVERGLSQELAVLDERLAQAKEKLDVIEKEKEAGEHDPDLVLYGGLKEFIQLCEQTKKDVEKAMAADQGKRQTMEPEQQDLRSKLEAISKEAKALLGETEAPDMKKLWPIVESEREIKYAIWEYLFRAERDANEVISSLGQYAEKNLAVPADRFNYDYDNGQYISGPSPNIVYVNPRVFNSNLATFNETL